jgi:beta-glucosidase
MRSRAARSRRTTNGGFDDSARRVLYAEFLSGIVGHPIEKGIPNVQGALQIAQKVEEESIVRLKNKDAVLPLSPSEVHSVALIGGHADIGMLSETGPLSSIRTVGTS